MKILREEGGGNHKYYMLSIECVCGVKIDFLLFLLKGGR